MGQVLFNPEDAKGWDWGTSWMNTGTLFARASRLPRVEIRRPPSVVGTNTVRDHRGGQDVVRHNATLFSFTRAGVPAWVTAFPEGGITSAAPNIWRSGTTEIVMVPVLYSRFSTYELHVVAFSTGSTCSTSSIRRRSASRRRAAVPAASRPRRPRRKTSC